MDTSKEYIEMCQKAVEVQDKLPRNEDENGRKYVDSSTYIIKYDIETKRLIWLPRQDQLQNMLDEKPNPSRMHNLLIWAGIECDVSDLRTWEQLWLAFVMHEKYSKQWLTDRKEWMLKIGMATKTPGLMGKQFNPAPQGRKEREMGECFVCTKENPWNGNGRAEHPDAEIIYSHDGFFFWDDGFDKYECPHCFLIFNVTKPQPA